jgi:hypothetical protein
MWTRKPRSNLEDVINKRDRWDLHTLEEIAQQKHSIEHGWCSHTSRLLLAIWSDLIQHRKWRRLREMHTCSTPTTLPPWSSEIWWSGRWDRQHDSVVSMVESFCRQGFACLRGGRRTVKRGFRLRAAPPRKLDLPRPWRDTSKTYLLSRTLLLLFLL